MIDTVGVICEVLDVLDEQITIYDRKKAVHIAVGGRGAFDATSLPVSSWLLCPVAIHLTS